ncbi:MAG: hypothetical protein ACRAVC_14925, partial [Trichormus sp.]
MLAGDEVIVNKSLWLSLLKKMTIDEYYQKYGSKITQDSERLFVEEFLYPLVGSKIEAVVPQYP